MLNLTQYILVTYCIGIDVLSKWTDASWKECYELTFGLYSLKAELLALTGDYDQAEAMYPTLLQQARSNKDTCAVYLIMYFQYELQVWLALKIYSFINIIFIDLNVIDTL